MPNVAGQKFPYTAQGMAAAEEQRNLLNRGAMGAPLNIPLGGKRTAPKASQAYSGMGSGGPMFPGMGLGGPGMGSPGGNRSSSGGRDFIPLPGSDPPVPHPIFDPGWQPAPGWHPPLLNPKPPIYVKPYHYDPSNPYLPETPHIPNPLYPIGPYGPRKPPADYDDYWGPGKPNPLIMPR